MVWRSSLLIIGLAASTYGGISHPTAARAYVQNADSATVVFRFVDADGQPVASLTSDQLDVQDNTRGVREFRLAYGAPSRRTPLRIVLVLDASGSMQFDRKIDRLKQSAATVVDGMSDQDLCAIVEFSSRATLLSDFTNDRTVLKEKIGGIKPSGYTAIYDAVFAALNLFDTRVQDASNVVMLFSDGQEEGRSLFTLSDITPRIYQIHNLTINTFDLNAGDGVNDLRRLALLSGGSYAHSPDAAHLFHQFSQFLDQFRNEYSLSYRLDRDESHPVHHVQVGLVYKGTRYTLTSEYTVGAPVEPRLGQLPPTPYVAGGVAVILMGIAGAFVVVRRRYSPQFLRNRPTRAEVYRRIPGVDRSTATDERTRILDQLPIDVDEKTVILDTPRRHTQVLGSLLIDGPGLTQHRVEMGPNELLLGRSAQCAIHLSDPSVSRLHAKIRHERDSFVLYDLGSANGTFVNGIEIQIQDLKSDDQIGVGKYRLVFTANKEPR